MTDLSFAEYWQQVSAELERIFGIAGEDLGVPGDRIADCFRAGREPTWTALDIGAALGLRPRPGLSNKSA